MRISYVCNANFKTKHRALSCTPFRSDNFAFKTENCTIKNITQKLAIGKEKMRFTRREISRPMIFEENPSFPSRESFRNAASNRIPIFSISARRRSLPLRIRSLKSARAARFVLSNCRARQKRKSRSESVNLIFISKTVRSLSWIAMNVAPFSSCRKTRSV